MESEVSLQGLQKPSNTPHPEPHQQSVPSTFCYLKLNFNIIFHSMPRSSKWAPSFMLPHQTPPLPQTCCIPPPSKSSLLIRSPCSLLRITDHEAPLYAVFSSLLLPRPSLSTRSSNTINLFSPDNATCQK